MRALVLTLVFALCGISSAAAQTDQLTTDQKEVFQKVANQALCPCNCPLTLSGCIKDKPKCKRASILARFVARSVQKNLTAMDVLTELAEGFSGSQATAGAKFSKAPAYAIRGKAGAKIQIVEFADFRCPHCREATHFVEQLVTAMGDKIEFSFRHFPIQNLEPSILAAEAAEAAGAQGKFKEMHELLFKNQDALAHDDLVRYAKDLKLDVKRFTQELDAHKYKAKVIADKDEATKAGVQGTPAFFINGKEVKLDRTVENFKDRMDYELAVETECAN